MTLKKIEPRFIAGPPGTGKTHDFILGLYKKLLKEDYPPEKIVILSHTNVAANQIKEAVLKLPEMQGRGFTLKSMKKTYTITQHSLKILQNVIKMLPYQPIIPNP